MGLIFIAQNLEGFRVMVWNLLIAFCSLKET